MYNHCCLSWNHSQLLFGDFCLGVLLLQQCKLATPLALCSWHDPNWLLDIIMALHSCSDWNVTIGCLYVCRRPTCWQIRQQRPHFHISNLEYSETKIYSFIAAAYPEWSVGNNQGPFWGSLALTRPYMFSSCDKPSWSKLRAIEWLIRLFVSL